MRLNYFKSGAAFREWLETHHDRATELWVGFYKKTSGRTGITYDEAVEEALCFGWIDGIKKRVDDLSYCHRFTPRQPRSVWSRLNIERVRRLKRAGRMMPAGLKTFAVRQEHRSGIYSFENAPRRLSPAEEKQFQIAKSAWDYFQQQPPGYRRLSIWWVTGAKRAETRARRLGQLIADSRQRRRLGQQTGKHLTRIALIDANRNGLRSIRVNS